MAGSEKKTAIELLHLVQAELKAPKTESGRFGKHRNAEGIIEAVKPLLAKYKLALTLDSDIVEVGGKNYVKATAIVWAESGDAHSVNALAWEGEVSRGLDAPQVTGAASSYARKYALGGLFAIDDSKDDPDSHDAPAPEITKPKIATGPEKFKLQQMMKEKGMTTADEMTMFIESVVDKKKVETHEDFVEVYHALTDGVDDQPTDDANQEADA